MSEEKERIVLTGDEALEKFLAGKDVWNAYVNEYPEADVDFSGVDFSYYRPKKGRLSFMHYRFPKKGHASFSGTKFGNGGVDFSFAEFGERGLSFFQAKFSNGDVNFIGANFGNGDVNFIETQFGSGYVNFSDTIFGNGSANFFCTQFGNKGVSFRNAKFGEIGVNFSGSRFGDESANFTGALFGGEISKFTNVKFGNGDICYSRCEFKGHVSFNNLQEPNKLKTLSFKRCAFHKTLDISDNNFKCIPDLTNTKLTNQLSLDRMTCEYQIVENGLPDIADGERLCRLKELAEANKNHQQALVFHAQEMRVKRYFSTGCAKQLDGLFDCVSRYGLSISRPTIGLGFLTGSFAFIYSLISLLIVCPTQITEIIKTFGNGILYATAQVLPFVSSGRLATLESANRLFGSDMPNWIYMFSLAQGSLSFVLLFLIGLGVRNRFRL